MNSTDAIEALDRMLYRAERHGCSVAEGNRMRELLERIIHDNEEED